MANSELKSLLITQREDHDKLKKVGLMIVFFVKFMCLKCVIHYNVCYVFINFSFIIHNFISNFCQQYIFKTCYLFIEGISKYMYVTFKIIILSIKYDSCLKCHQCKFVTFLTWFPLLFRTVYVVCVNT